MIFFFLMNILTVYKTSCPLSLCYYGCLAQLRFPSHTPYKPAPLKCWLSTMSSPRAGKIESWWSATPPDVTVLSLQPLLFMDLLDERTLVAVERPLDDIIAQLPPPIKKKKFGT